MRLRGLNTNPCEIHENADVLYDQHTAYLDGYTSFDLAQHKASSRRSDEPTTHAVSIANAAHFGVGAALACFGLDF